MLNKIDVYTVMLGVSLMAILVGILLLTVELSRYSGKSPAQAAVSRPAQMQLVGHGINGPYQRPQV